MPLRQKAARSPESASLLDSPATVLGERPSLAPERSVGSAWLHLSSRQRDRPTEICRSVRSEDCSCERLV